MWALLGRSGHLLVPEGSLTRPVCPGFLPTLTSTQSPTPRAPQGAQFTLELTVRHIKPHPSWRWEQEEEQTRSPISFMGHFPPSPQCPCLPPLKLQLLTPPPAGQARDRCWHLSLCGKTHIFFFKQTGKRRSGAAKVPALIVTHWCKCGSRESHQGRVPLELGGPF